MIPYRLRPKGGAKVAGKVERKHKRLGRYIVLIFGAGITSGVAALAGIPPFGSVQALLGPVSKTLHPTPPPSPILASAVFPSVPPVHKVVDVYDPAPPARKSEPQPPPKPPMTTPTPRHHPSPSPSPIHSSPSPPPTDN
jgi:hypothetical protein